MNVKIGEFIDNVLHYLDLASKGEDIKIDLKDGKYLSLTVGGTGAKPTVQEVCNHTYLGHNCIRPYLGGDLGICSVCGKVMPLGSGVIQQEDIRGLL